MGQPTVLTIHVTQIGVVRVTHFFGLGEAFDTLVSIYFRFELISKVFKIE